MTASNWSSSTAVECDAEPYMLSLFVADEHMNGERMMPVLDPHKLEARLRAATSDLEALHGDGEKKGKKDPSSGPPSPPSSDGSTTPRITIAPCPPRLKPYSPPVNYGTVEVGEIYRSGFPQDRNMDFCRGMGIRSVLTLVDSTPSEGYVDWIASTSINHLKINLATNKDGVVNTTLDSLCQALLFVMDSSNYPLHIHCNQGKHRTGCIVACLRKIQRVPLDQVIREYVAYSSPKQRDGDIKLITDFDPKVVFAYAKRHDHLDGSLSRFARNDSTIGDIDSLAAAMKAGAAMAETEKDVNALSSAISDTSMEDSDDEVLEMSVASTSNKARGTPNELRLINEVDGTRGLDAMASMESTHPPPSSEGKAAEQHGNIGPRLWIEV